MLSLAQKVDRNEVFAQCNIFDRIESLRILSCAEFIIHYPLGKRIPYAAQLYIDTFLKPDCLSLFVCPEL